MALPAWLQDTLKDVRLLPADSKLDSHAHESLYPETKKEWAFYSAIVVCLLWLIGLSVAFYVESTRRVEDAVELHLALESMANNVDKKTRGVIVHVGKSGDRICKVLYQRGVATRREIRAQRRFIMRMIQRKRCGKLFGQQLAKKPIQKMEGTEAERNPWSEAIQL
ncbi:MAG: hypothetical protein M1819_002180 [Sarea resinae]|nr:MAG: hypothetical protein M1819_002180 [Sarea resinae]